MVSARLAAVLAVVLLIVGAVFVYTSLRPGVSGVVSTHEATSSTGQGPGFLKGLSFSPENYSAGGIDDFFTKAVQAGRVVEWAGDWEQIDGPGSPATVAKLAEQRGLESIVVVQFFSQSTGGLLRPLNSTNEQRYVVASGDFARQYKPDFFGVGLEVNVLYEKNVTAYREFLTLYPRVYDQVKSASPSTLVFTVFQLEKMKGLGGGLYGGTNDPGRTEWRLMADFSKDDLAAFTTYPGLIYQSPSEIPSDYYRDIGTFTNKTVGFTEVGWHTGFLPGGWGSNETEQADFVRSFFSLSGTLPMAFVVWSFLYDQNAPVPFSTMGMFTASGVVKLAWLTWLGES